MSAVATAYLLPLRCVAWRGVAWRGVAWRGARAGVGSSCAI